MKLKKILILGLIFIMCIQLCSCKNKSSLDLYQAYVCNSYHSKKDTDYGDIQYNIPRQTYSLPELNSSIQIGMSDRQLQLSTEEIKITYNQTYNKDGLEYKIDSYSNELYGINVDYRKDTGNLEYLHLGNYEYKISSNSINSEAELLRISNEYLSKLVEDLNRYTIEIETKIGVQSENGFHNEKVDGFMIAPVSDDSVTYSTRYTVSYVFYIDGVKTAESLSMTITSDGYLKIVSCNMVNDFEPFSNCKVDIDLCNQIISSELQMLCNIEKYQYNGYTDTKILTIVDNCLCILSFADPIFSSNESEDLMVEPIQILIPIEYAS